MVQTLEAIKGGGGSIKIGTTGTISALMSKELESMKMPQSTISALVPAQETSLNKLKPKTLADEASSSNTNIVKNQKCSGTAKKSKNSSGSTHHIPMLMSGDVSVDGTPIRKKPNRKAFGMVEIVDIKCGNTDKPWVQPITNRLKKLGFSKLSESIV